MKYLLVKTNFRADRSFTYSPRLNLSIALGRLAEPEVSPWVALWELGGVPQLHHTDRLSAAVHDHCDKGSGEGRAGMLQSWS